jgi:diaminohydroxyphosphoribosylaminopyrimidine deaminase/5-amino-6-(5-phosphoribosylamino)uracil reductase
MPGGRNPVRIILDSDLRIPMESRLVQTAKETPLIVIRRKKEQPASQKTGAVPADPERAEMLAERQALLEEAGVTVLAAGEDAYGLRIPEVLQELGKRKIDGILVEGGSRVNASFVRAGAVQHIYAYIGAKIFGGSKYPPVREAGILQVEDALELTDPKVQIFGSDVLLEYDCPASAGVRMRAPG